MQKTIQQVVDMKGKRILVVEDIEINRIIICETLSVTEVEIDEATNGQDAVDIFSGSDIGYYDLILMDVQMPVLDGLAATRAIRGLSRADAGKIPIIALTANAYREDVMQVVSAGMNGHLSKPIDVSELMKVLAKSIVRR